MSYANATEEKHSPSSSTNGLQLRGERSRTIAHTCSTRFARLALMSLLRSLRIISQRVYAAADVQLPVPIANCGAYRQYQTVCS
ncbi:hypothetical protein GBF35_02970 [Nonomuraea phyllanthi]|uniref:hypothetical protein n=1 Tax=Nonomuraea phyllanthi TaxID=2219224 RepID=UPI001293F193|nr:hypothetical protein [Nonomuraea phyllanthi]QFY05769.1 hypothetical protein GBF35_02970 [Nonomuraea phyllanthi]